MTRIAQEVGGAAGTAVAVVLSLLLPGRPKPVPAPPVTDPGERV
jgi:hypothetical protein